MRVMMAAWLAAVIGTPASAVTPVAGRWLTADGAVVVEIGSCGASMCGRVSRIIIRAPGSAAVDVANPSPALRRRAILGLPILTDFVADGDAWHGRIYDPRKGKTYKSVISRQRNGTLKVQGCIAFFCQTQIWTRTSNSTP